MENHYFDDAGTYVKSAPANAGTLPPINALRRSPPKKEGYWPVLNANGDGWEMREDHRGRRGWLNGRETAATELGPLPEGWSDVPPAPASPATDDMEKRVADYPPGTDTLRDFALGYQAEADGWRLIGDGVKEREAREKAESHLRLYAEKMEEIRRQSALSNGSGEDVPDVFYLAGTGTYHARGCASIRPGGEWLPLAEILDHNPGAHACGRCKPGPKT